jgi:sodium-dependent dicarboxylate transporter 2/3/5
MAMNVFEASTGISISFLQWGMICTPLAIITLFACWFSVVKVFKPEKISDETIAHIRRQGQEIGKLEKFDIKVLVIIALVFSAWIASNWTGWDTSAIAIAGLAILFIPGIDALKWDEYVQSVAWNIVILIGCVQSISGGVREQGAANWLFGATIGKLGLSGPMLIGAAAFILPLLKIVIPVGPAFIAICMIPLTAMSDVIGVNPVVLGMMVGINSSTTFLMGIDGNNLLSYRHGYWSLIDFFKSGVIPTLAMSILHATLLSPLVTLVGL